MALLERRATTSIEGRGRTGRAQRCIVPGSVTPPSRIIILRTVLRSTTALRRSTLPERADPRTKLLRHQRPVHLRRLQQAQRAAAGDGQVVIRWSPSTGATSYNL